jgi:hypothetical protein
MISRGAAERNAAIGAIQKARAGSASLEAAIEAERPVAWRPSGAARNARNPEIPGTERSSATG